MLDNILGRPGSVWRRREVFAVISFCIWTLFTSSRRGPKVLWLRRLNRELQHFSPWQLLFGSLSIMYALRNFDKLIGLDASSTSPHLYSPAYFRATWITTALDCGFATAMSIRSLWLRQLSSIIFSLYYLVHADAADAKLRRLRENCTVDMLRATWDKTTNPYIRFLTSLTAPSLPLIRKLTLTRPSNALDPRPITAYLYYSGSPSELSHTSELILDFPGGGFVAMSPEHHEERLRMWALRTKKPVLSIEYGKAPEYPFPYAIYECFDAYRYLVETSGRSLGMSGHKLDIILSGDSAGGNIAVNVMFMILESERSGKTNSRSSISRIPRPVAITLAYPALNFAFSSWAWPSNVSGSGAQRHYNDALYAEAASAVRPHVGPFKPKASWTSWGTLAKKDSLQQQHDPLASNLHDVEASQEKWMKLTSSGSSLTMHSLSSAKLSSLFERQQEAQALQRRRMRKGVFFEDELRPRVTMSSRTGYIHDRVISPSMMWAMAMLYLGRNWSPELETDYRVSPVLAPDELLAEFPPILLQCGGRDPLVDDTMVFAGRIKEAKARVREKRLHKVTTKVKGEKEELKTPMPSPPASETSSHSAASDDSIEPGEERFAVEGDDDMQVQIFGDWSHGYLQMATILPEAKTAINDIADWICDRFER